MLTHIHSEADLDRALAALIEADLRFHALVAIAGRPPLRRRPDGFVGLAAIVVAQQLSTASASAIWARLTASFDPLTPQAVLRAQPARLKRLGLSLPKIRALKEIARAVVAGDLAPAGLSRLTAEKAHGVLTALHGVGPWTADIYLLSCLGHADAWPAGDLALQEAVRLAFGLKARPTASDMASLAEKWRPWRAVAARVLWSYYRAAKGRDGAPIPPADPPRKAVAQRKPMARGRAAAQPGSARRRNARRGSDGR